MTRYLRPEHQVISEALRLMDRDFLTEAGCWFGGGTAIVMLLGEYRRSLDVDFLCSSVGGYCLLRSAATERGLAAFFTSAAKPLRDFRIDQYGLRTVFEFKGQQIKFEIVREGRIELDGRVEPELGVPVLTVRDMFAEKLLANADRCQDRSVAYRDAFDLGMLVEHHGELPADAVAKARLAYGADIDRKLNWVVEHLENENERNTAATSLMMSSETATRAIEALGNAVKGL